MKSKILLFGLLSILIFSCKSDDDSITPSDQPGSDKLMTLFEYDLEWHVFTYNEDKTVQKIALSAERYYKFSYANDRISSIDVNEMYGEDDFLWEFQYDSNGKINSFSNGIDEIDVVYNASERSYTYQKGDEKITLMLTEDGDIKKYSILNTLTNVTAIREIFYENSKIGPLYNSNSIAVHWAMTRDYLDMSTYTSKKPIKGYRVNDTNVSFENTYDDEGFITNSMMPFGSIKYEYN